MKLDLEALQHIAAVNNAPAKADAIFPEDRPGICTPYLRQLWNKGLVRFFADADAHEWTLRKAMALWPKYSGNPVFPVPSPDPDISETVAYLNYRANRWDRKTEYGALRWELLEFLIELAEKDWDSEQATSA